MAQDFIDSFLSYTEQISSPYIFRLWAGIAGVAGALERRCWVKALPQPTYANLFVLLVAAPGIGKGVIDEITRIWRQVKRLHLAPDSVTSASLLDSLLEADRKVVHNGSLAFEYHSLIVPSEEFGVLVPSHDLEFLSRLNRIFTNPDVLRVRRKYLKEEVSIVNPQMTILAGTQPGYLGSLLPEEAWSMGFTQRLLLIHSSLGADVELFGDYSSREGAERTLVRSMEQMSVAMGQFQWEPSAAKALSKWHSAGGPPKPEHRRLTHYVNRRTQFMLKLMLISSASRGELPIITDFDYERALTWLLAAEASMPDVFREMVQKSDVHVINELVRFAWQLYLRSKHKPIHEARLHAFLAERVPSEKVPHILALAIRSGHLEQDKNDVKCYKPRPKDELQ
jgi:hypothetical protein